MAGTGFPMKQAWFVAMLFALSACGGGETPAGAAAGKNADAPARQREGRLEVLAIAGALPANSAILRAFEEETACKLQLQTAPDSAELLALVAQVDADIVLAGGDIAVSLVSSGRVRALDPKRLPSLAHVDPRLRALPGALVEGRRFGVPWRWQPVVLAYDNARYLAPPASWSELYAPAADPLPQVLAGADPLLIADAALLVAATRPELGIVDPYALDPKQYAAALSLLQTQKATARGTWRDLASQAEGFRNGVSASASTPAMVQAMRGQGLAVAWTLPAEGGSAEVEVAMLHANASHPECAQAWLEWSLSPQAQAQLAADAGALPAVAAACAIEPLAGENACARDGMALLPRLHLRKVPRARCGSRTCVPFSRWTRDYLALLAAP